MRWNSFSSPTRAPRGLPDPETNTLQAEETLAPVIEGSLFIPTLDLPGVY